MAEPKKRTLQGVYDGLKQISNEEGKDFGIDNYTYEQFQEKYKTPQDLLMLYYKLSDISDETGRDFGIGSENEWLGSFGEGRATGSGGGSGSPTAGGSKGGLISSTIRETMNRGRVAAQQGKANNGNVNGTNATTGQMPVLNSGAASRVQFQQAMASPQMALSAANASPYELGGTTKTDEAYMPSDETLAATETFPQIAKHNIEAYNINRQKKRLDEELQDAYVEQERLDEEIERRKKEIDKQYPAYASGFGRAMYGAEMGKDLYSSDNEIAMLETAKRKNKEAIKIMERERGDDGFFRTVGKTLFSRDNWDFGVGDFSDMLTIMRNGDKEQSGSAEEARQSMLRNMAVAQDVQAKYGDNDTFWQRAGQLTGNAIPFVVEFAATGGGFDAISKAGTRLGSRLATKAGANKFGQFVLKNTGTLAGDVASSLLLANSTGLLRTSADIMQRHQGELQQDEQGNYRFDGGKSWARSIYEGEMASTIEYFTEKLGKTLYDPMLEKISAGRMSKLFSRVKDTEWNELLGEGGINSYLGEVLEEESGIMLNAMLTGDNKISDLWDLKTQADIWGGMALSIGFMKAPSTVEGGYNAAQYYRYKHNTDKADKVASFRMTKEVWEPLKERIDGSTNEQMKDVSADIIANNDLSETEKKAALDYINNLMRMRGYNLRTTAEARDKFANVEPDGVPVDEGATEVDNNRAYADGYHADSEEGKEIALEYANGIGYRTPEQRQAAMDGVRQQIEDRAATSAAEEREIAAQYTYEDGSERPATMLLPDGEGNYTEAQVYVKSGNIVMNGDAIDADRSDQTVIVFNPRTGLKQQVATSDLTMGVARSAEEVEAEIEQRRQQFIQREWDVLTNKVFPGNDIGVEGGRATVLAMDDQTATLLMPDGSQADMPIADVQRLKDDERLAEYIATHPDARAANGQGAAAADTGDGTAAAGSQPAEVEGVPTDYSEGMMVTLRDGRTMEVTAVGRMSSDENGIYFEPQANGQIVELFDPQTGDNEHLDRKQMNAQVVSYQAAPEATAAAVEDRTAAAPEATPATPATPESPATAETPGATPATPEQPIVPEAPATGATPEAPAASSMPMRKVKVRVGKKAEEVEEPDFMAVTPEETRRWIYEESGYPEAVASQLIQSKITEANNQMDNLRKNEPKFGDKGIGTSVAAYNQRHNEWQQQQQSWKQTLDYWTNVWQQQLAIDNEREAAERAERLRRNEEVRKAIEAEQRAKEAEEAERKAEAEAKRQQVEDELAATAEVKGEPLTLGERVEVPARLQQMIDNATGNRAVLLRQAVEDLGDDPEALDLLTDEHPRTLEEVAASMLRSGKNQVRLMFADEGVLKGVGSMMGYTRADMSRFPSLFASREKGGVSIERFGEMVEEEARNEGVMYDENDATAGLTAVQNLLGSVSTQADINDYLLNGRIEDAREKRAAAIRMMEMRYEEEIRQRYDMTAAERDAWVAYMDEQAEAVANMSDEEFNNQILSYNGNQTARDTEQLQAEQSGESGTDEGGGNAGNEEGAGSRSEADETAGAPDDAGRDRQGPGRAEGTEQPASPVAEAIARQEVNENPTEGQKESGNYKKAHVRLDGYALTIENRKGSVRSGVDPNGKSWSQEMHNDYGYILGTEGVDGDHIDVFLSDTPEEGDVFVVDQVNADGTFDEHKVMYGFPDIESARQAYLSNYEEGWQGLGAITPVSKEEFKKWVESSHRKTKPFSEYRSVETLGDVQVENGVKEQKGDDAAVGTQIPSEAEKALRDELIEVMSGEGGMEVITDEEGQRVLDEYRDRAKLLKTFHGSGADFDAFDHSHMGEGEGDQAYGYGTYVTEVEGIGRMYASVIGSKKVTYVGEKPPTHYASEIVNVMCIELQGGKTFDSSIERTLNTLHRLQDDYNRGEGESSYEKEITFFENVKESDFDVKEQNRVLYTVEIPDDNGSNYLEWDKPIKPIVDKIDKALSSIGLSRQEMKGESGSYIRYTNESGKIIEIGKSIYGDDFYTYLKRFFGSDKAASEFLHNAGFTGIKYPAEFRSGGRGDKAKNYVIFDEGDLKITDKTRFFRTEEGEVYGFTMDGKIYIDPKVATSETPIHEYSHLWAQALRKANPQAWEQLKSEMMKDQDLVDYVRRKYPEIENEDALMEEVFAHYSGRRGAERLRSEMREEMDKADGVFNKAQVASVFARLKSLLSKFWKMARNLFAGKVRGVKKLSAEDFADMAMNDLMNGFKPNEVTTEEEEKTLMGVHNISEEKLKKALKQGGFANPSMAVIDTKRGGFDSYGDISLIPKASLIDSRTGRNAGTYGGDAWTPTYPNVEYYEGKETAEKLKALTAELPESLGEYIRRRVSYYMDKNTSTSGLEYLFLKEHGIDMPIAHNKRHLPNISNKEIHDRIGVSENIYGSDLYREYEKMPQEQLFDFNLWLDKYGDEAEIAKVNDMIARLRNEGKDEAATFLIDRYSKPMTFANFDTHVYNVGRDEREAGSENLRATLENAAMEVNKQGLRKEFDAWLEKQIDDLGYEERLFAGYTPSGNRRHLPNTLENASRLMNKESDVNAYDNTSLNATRAALMYKMQSLDDIRKHRNLLQERENNKTAYEEMSDKMLDVAHRLSDMQVISDNPFMNTDYAILRMQEAFTKKDPIGYLNKEYGYSIDKDGELAKDMLTFIDEVKDMPVKYFETKFKRPVMLDEFAVAVVPEGTSQEVVDALQNAGLDVRTYDGTSENRQAVTLEAVSGRDDIRFQKGGTYKTKDGVQLTMQSLLDEVDGQTRLFDSEGEVIAPAESSAHEDVGGPAGAAEDLTGLRLRKLKPGETCLVERRYEENKMFSFVGKEKIESMDDVAFIFKQLEDAAVENVFVAMVKDGRPTVIHIGMGTYNQSVADYKLAFAAYAKIKPDKVWMVHNHPSGSLRASRDDRNLLQVGRETFGNDVMQDGIIIDTVSGKYGVFNDFGENYEQNMPEASRDAVPVKTYEFSKQVFAPEWNPREAFQLSDSGKVAEFVSSHRLGEHKKMSFIVTNNQNQVVGNFFLPWTKMSDAAKKPEDASRELSNFVNLAGGTKGVLYGNYEYDSKENRALGKLIESMRKLRTPLLDVVHFDKEAVYHSAAETGAMEPGGEYGEHKRTVIEALNDSDKNIARQAFKDILAKGGLKFSQNFSHKNGSDYYTLSIKYDNGNVDTIRVRVADHPKPTEQRSSYVDGENDFRNYKDAYEYLTKFFDLTDKTSQIEELRKDWMSQVKEVELNGEKVYQIGDGGMFATPEAAVDNKMNVDVLPRLTGQLRNDDIRYRLLDENSDAVVDNAEVGTRPLSDREKVAKLEAEPTVKVYRSMQVIDGQLYPPMSAKSEGQLREPSKIGVWEEADERPELADANGQFTLNKGNGKSLKAAYNPYIHTSRTMLNDQFSEAQSRPNLVVVEMEVPESELTGSYKAEKAKDSVGAKQWKAGVIQGQLSGTREVILSRWAKPVRIVPDSEVAQNIYDQIKGQVEVMPSNVVTPQVRTELEKLGVQFVDTDNTGKLIDGENKGKTWASVYGRPKPSKKTVAAMRERAEQMGEKLHTKINIVDNGDGLKGRQKSAKGWYNPVTGEVTLVLGNNRDVEDVAATVGHEVIGHKGMRELVGEERYNDFLDMVYKHLRGDLKARVDSRAGREFMNEVVGSNGSKGRYEEHRRRVVDELLGELAEKPFDEFSEGERTLWQRIKQAVREILDRFLDTLRLPKWFELGDNELRYMLWRSKERMERGKMDYADMARDAVKRRELGLDDELRFRDDDAGNEQQPVGRLGLYERMSEVKLASAEKNAGDLNKRNEAIRAIDANLRDLEKAMRAQREYDRTTVKRVSDLAQILMKYGWLENMGKQEVSRVLSAIKNANGKEDISKEMQTVIDVMVDNQLRRAEKRLEEMESIKAVKVDAKGVEVQGALDVAGQTMLKAFKEARGFSKEYIEKEIEDVQDRMGSNNAAVAEEAAQRFVGLQLAKEYVENINAKKEEEAELRKSIREYDGPAKSKKDFVANVEDAIRQNKVERIESYQALMQKMADPLSASVAKAQEFKDREVERIREIQHNANSDMEGKPDDEHRKAPTGLQKTNNIFANTVLAPLQTFSEMLRLFGSKSANGEGYLYNRFVRGFIDARQQEIKGKYRRYAELDAKVKELFGYKNMARLITKTADMPRVTVEWWNRNRKMMEPFEVTQGNLMYMYMVNKMTDGRMKLRGMGITEAAMETYTATLDPKLKEFADWIQDEFLVKTRNEYNETHKRLFGANMAAIENYFPLKILPDARKQTQEELDQHNWGDGITTKTGAIVKRTRNALALDLLNADALNVLLQHVEEMEHWNAFAEFNRDLNTLRTYKHFRNQVKNMNTIYGSGKELWDNFNVACQIATGSYKPQRSKFDVGALKAAQLVSAAKVSLRINTALKQLLSLPAYLPYINVEGFVRSIASNVRNKETSFKWCMEHLPLFEERWKSRVSGDPKLVKSMMDWTERHTNLVQMIGRGGMFPNALVDAITVSIGAHAVYETKKSQYLKDGYSEEQAERKAIQDAELAYNETQQSSEGAFVSSLQQDHSWLSTIFTVFRNSSMAYTRRLYDALRDTTNNLTPKQREATIAFMTKQMVREGLSEEQAKDAAKRRFNRKMRKDLISIATFGFIVELAWNLGGNMWYLLFGDDDDEKSKMWENSWVQSMFGGLEGLTGGDLMSELGRQLITKDYNPNSLNKEMPISGDVAKVVQRFFQGKKEEAMNDLLNLAVQMGFGVNPQTISDFILSATDICGGDMALTHEAVIFAARFTNVPQSQIDKLYFDEIGLSGEEASHYTPQQLIERYAKYKVKRGRLIEPWAWDDEKQIGKQKDKAEKLVKERMERMGDAEVNAKYEQLAEEMKDMGARERAAKAAAKRDYAEAARLWTEIGRDAALYNRYQQFKAMDQQLDRLAEEYLSAKSAEGAVEMMEQMIQLKKQMVDDLASE